MWFVLSGITHQIVSRHRTEDKAREYAQKHGRELIIEGKLSRQRDAISTPDGRIFVLGAGWSQPVV